jgi:branched-chain amino acid transport system substrate-binding protein
MDVPTLSKVESVYSDQLQKPSGADFWEWIKSTSFPI